MAKNKETEVWKWVKKWVKKVDNLVTGMIVWWAVVSIFGLSRTKKWKRVAGAVVSAWKVGAKYGYSLFWKTLARTVGFLFKNK